MFYHYSKYIERDKALTRRFQPVMVEEPHVGTAIEICLGLKCVPIQLKALMDIRYTLWTYRWRCGLPAESRVRIHFTWGRIRIHQDPFSDLQGRIRIHPDPFPSGPNPVSPRSISFRIESG